jgi:hypothetical protein
LGSWLLLGINNLTHPITIFATDRNSNARRGNLFQQKPNGIGRFGEIASAVVGYAFIQCLIVETGAEWAEFWDLIMDLTWPFASTQQVMFLAVFQPLILARANNGHPSLWTIAHSVGLAAWLIQSDIKNMLMLSSFR